jgi:TPR repeat protein
MAYLYRIGIGFEKNDILASSYMNRVNSYLLNNLKNKKSITINNQNYLINKKYLTNQNEHILVYMDMLHSMILNNDVNTSLSEEILLLANEGKFDAMIAVSSSYIKQKKFIKAKKYLQELMLKFNDINATKQLILYYAIKNNNVSEFIKLNEKILDIKGIYKMKKILLNDIKNCVKKYSLHQCYFSEQLYKVKNYDDGTIENIVADKYFDLYFENHQYANLENAIKLYNKSLQKGRKLNNIFLAYLYTYNDYVAKNSELALNYLMQLDFNIIKNNHLFQELYIINVINNLIENKQNVNKLEKTYAIHKENFTKLLRLMEKDNNPNYYFLRYKIYINELFNKKKTLARKQLLNGIKNGHYLLYNNLYWHDKTFLTYPSSKKLDNDFINHSKQYNLNDSITLNTLGHIYKDREDYKKAYESFYESLSIDSIYWLAKMNLSGLGVKKNILEALKYYDLSAKLGNINSMANLCRKYSFGYKSHIPINLKLAKFYYNLAKKFGITDKELQVYGCDFTNLKEEKRK